MKLIKNLIKKKIIYLYNCVRLKKYYFIHNAFFLQHIVNK